MYSFAAAYNNPARRTTRAHKLLPHQLIILPVVERSHNTIDPIIPGKAAAALPARFASNLARLCSCFLTHSLAPSCDGGFDGVAAPPTCWNNSLNDHPYNHTNGSQNTNYGDALFFE